MESWNTEHGIQATDEVQETIVEEMKVAQAAGDDRRSKIQGGFAQSAAQLDGAQESLAALSARLEEAAKGAEAASSAFPSFARAHLSGGRNRRAGEVWRAHCVT